MPKWTWKSQPTLWFSEDLWNLMHAGFKGALYESHAKMNMKVTTNVVIQWRFVKGELCDNCINHAVAWFEEEVLDRVYRWARRNLTCKCRPPTARWFRVHCHNSCNCDPSIELLEWKISFHDFVHSKRNLSQPTPSLTKPITFGNKLRTYETVPHQFPSHLNYFSLLPVECVLYTTLSR